MFARIYGREILQEFEKNKDVFFICGLTEIIHNATLIIDDLQDSSLARRGLPCTYLKYGIDYATNCGNFLYFMPLC